MYIKVCINCGKKVAYLSPADLKRKSKTGFCRACFLKNTPRGKGAFLYKRGYFFRDGYKFILSRNHPHANKLGYVREHRLVMEKTIGRFLRPTEVVHHRNGIRLDNRIENLQLIKDNSSHHKGGHLHPWIHKQCSLCSEKHMARGYCEKHYWKYFLKQHRANKKT